MRCTKGGQLSARPQIQTHTLTQETPPSISNLLRDPAGSAAKLQLLSGYITKEITDSWEGLVPTRLHQKLYRALHKTITLHQHGVWLHRNNVLHPQVDVYIPVDYGRKRTQKRELPEEEEKNPRDKQWMRQREAAFTRKRMWAGTPIPKTMRKRKHTPIPTPPAADSLSSSTEEWPTNNTSDDTDSNHTPDSPSPPRREEDLSSPAKRPRPESPPSGKHPGKRKRQIEVDIRKPQRPRKHPRSEVSPPGKRTEKRKRQTEIAIRKPQRPRKQHQSQKSISTQRKPQAPFQRRSVEDIITHIHETRSHLYERISTTSRNQQGKVSRRGVRRGRSGLRDLGGTSGDDTEDSRPRTTPTAHTHLHTPSEPQWAASTPPPQPQSGRLGVGRRRIRPTQTHTITKPNTESNTTTRTYTTLTAKDSPPTRQKTPNYVRGDKILGSTAPI